MANKQITIKQCNNSNGYDTLYPQTTAAQTVLSYRTSASFGGSNVTVDSALNKIAKKMQADKKIFVKVLDGKGNPIQGAKINGLLNSPVTNSSGMVTGIFVSDPLTIVSPYVDLNDITVNGASYVGSTNTLTVTLPIVGENGIKRFTSSQSVKFSKMIKTVDICCVGGGGGGGNLIISRSGTETYYHESGGGGGGAIVNSYGKSINADTDYILSVGSGGVSGTTGGVGGTTTFLSVSATGGGGAYVYQPDSSSSPIGKGGSAGSSGSGDGGDRNQNGENSTISEFNDGTTFYSGGGGGGGRKGGTPNGADGAYITGGYPDASQPHSATTPGIGGGGGGATYDNQIQANLPSSGGSGLVAIRFHF